MEPRLLLNGMSQKMQRSDPTGYTPLTRPLKDTVMHALSKDFIQGASYTFETIGNDTLDQNVTHYVTVVAHDGDVHRFGVTAQALLPYDPSILPNPVTLRMQHGGKPLAFRRYSFSYLLGLIMAAMVALFVMRRKDDPSAEWAHLAQDTYGIQNQERWDDDDMGMLASPTVAPPPMDAQPVSARTTSSPSRRLQLL